MGWGEPSRVPEIRYDRRIFVQVLIYHVSTETSGCHCGWGRRPEHLGLSHADHVADIYEEAVRMKAL